MAAARGPGFGTASGQPTQLGATVLDRCARLLEKFLGTTAALMIIFWVLGRLRILSSPNPTTPTPSRPHRPLT
jgi:hypothetical protein